MDMGDSFSKMKQKVKHRLTRRRRKSGRKEAGADWEIVDSEWIIDPAISLPRPEPHVMAGDKEGSGGNRDERQTYLADPSSQQDEPEPVQVGGCENNQQGEGEGVNGREVGQSYSHLDSGVVVAMGSGPGRGGDADKEDHSEKTCGV